MPRSDEQFREQDNMSRLRETQGADDKKAFSERYCLAVSDLGINDAEVGRRTGLQKSAISRYRTGAGLPEVGALFSLAAALGKNPRWLITGIGSPLPPIDASALDEEGEGALLSAYRNLGAADRATLARVADALSNDGAIDMGATRGAMQSSLSQAFGQGKMVHSQRQDYRSAPNAPAEGTKSRKKPT